MCASLVQLSMKLIDCSLQAYVIYCFFQLSVGYMGGERSLLTLPHGRPPKGTVFSFTLLHRELNLSDNVAFCVRLFPPYDLAQADLVDQNMYRSSPSLQESHCSSRPSASTMKAIWPCSGCASTKDLKLFRYVPPTTSFTHSKYLAY